MIYTSHLKLHKSYNDLILLIVSGDLQYQKLFVNQLKLYSQYFLRQDLSYIFSYID